MLANYVSWFQIGFNFVRFIGPPPTFDCIAKHLKPVPQDYVRYSSDISTKYSNDEKNTPTTDNFLLSNASSNWMRPAVGDAKSLNDFSSNIVQGMNAISGTASSTGPFAGFSAMTASKDGLLPSTTTAPKGVAAFNWNVPGLSTVSKSTAGAPLSAATVPAFTFGGGSSIGAATSNASSGTFGGFSVPVTAVTSSNVANDNGNNGDEEEGEGEPIMEAEKVLRHADDKDDIVCDCTCKLLRFDVGKGDNGKGEWIDVGKGNFRVTKCSLTGKQRMLIRNSVGKITFNAAFYKGMKIGRFSKVMLSFGVVVDDSGQLRNFMLKLRDCDIEGVLTAMQAAIGSL